ncbi:AMP-binding protein [Rhodohalobacter sp.]|uniref:AMP-binding protein n=1 Tax=Rhodohalobacter sp. TaxID=1974210 RepID=UPI002ACD7508|nr:AMP-binding protein [Rhodohalobacter sp.]MDZ7755219.1 AMP-binding protein [Rhodohalobacter sp.]
MKPSEKQRFYFSDMDALSDQPLDYENSPEDAAHLLFTSGSTGEPKGVINTHSNVIHFIDWATGYFGINSSDRISGHPPLHFDMSSLYLDTAISTGAELFPVPREMNIHPKFMSDFIRKNRLTQWFSVPSVLSLMSKFDVLEENDFPENEKANVVWGSDADGHTDLSDEEMSSYPDHKSVRPNGDHHCKQLLYGSAAPGK